MNEQERLDKINRDAHIHLQKYLEQLEKEEMSHNELLSVVYAGMIAAGVMGYSPEALSNDAQKAVNKIINLAEEHEDV